jgi:hypothetical protein
LDQDHDFREQLESRIRRFAEQRERIRTELVDLNHAMNSLEKRLEAAVEMYRVEFGVDPPVGVAEAKRVPRVVRAAGGVRAGGESWNSAIEAVLQDAGEPLHITEIWRRVQQRDFHTTAKDPLRAIASVLVRHPDAVRTAPNTFTIAPEDGPRSAQQTLETVAGNVPAAHTQEER